MADIDMYLSGIKKAVYGEDVRDSIINAISAINVVNETNVGNAETKTQLMLDNFKIYETVEQLPATGNAQYIYCVTDIAYTDADNGTCLDPEGSTGKTRWDADNQASPNNKAYVTFSSSYNLGENPVAAKPVMKRYYLKNKILSVGGQGGSVNYQVINLGFSLQDVTIVRRDLVEQQYTYNVAGWALQTVEFIGPTPSGSTSMSGINLSLEFDEFIYDSDVTSKGWKYSRTVTKSFTNLTASWVSGTTYRITTAMDVNHLETLLFTEMPLADDGTPTFAPSSPSAEERELYILLYGATPKFFTSYSEMMDTIYDCSFSRDLYGYDCTTHATNFVINSQGAYMLTFSFPNTPEPPNNWDVPAGIGDTATLYTWNQTLSKYIRLVCEIEHSVPDQDGTYVLQCTVNSGVVTYNWVPVS